MASSLGFWVLGIWGFGLVTFSLGFWVLGVEFQVSGFGLRLLGFRSSVLGVRL